MCFCEWHVQLASGTKSNLTKKRRRKEKKKHKEKKEEEEAEASGMWVMWEICGRYVGLYHFESEERLMNNMNKLCTFS